MIRIIDLEDKKTVFEQAYACVCLRKQGLTPLGHFFTGVFFSTLGIHHHLALAGLYWEGQETSISLQKKRFHYYMVEKSYGLERGYDESSNTLCYGLSKKGLTYYLGLLQAISPLTEQETQALIAYHKGTSLDRKIQPSQVAHTLGICTFLNLATSTLSPILYVQKELRIGTLSGQKEKGYALASSAPLALRSDGFVHFENPKGRSTRVFYEQDTKSQRKQVLVQKLKAYETLFAQLWDTIYWRFHGTILFFGFMHTLGNRNGELFYQPPEFPSRQLLHFSMGMTILDLDTATLLLKLRALNQGFEKVDQSMTYFLDFIDAQKWMNRNQYGVPFLMQFLTESGMNLWNLYHADFTSFSRRRALFLEMILATNTWQPHFLRGGRFITLPNELFSSCLPSLLPYEWAQDPFLRQLLYAGGIPVHSLHSYRPVHPISALVSGVNRFAYEGALGRITLYVEHWSFDLGCRVRLKTLLQALEDSDTTELVLCIFLDQDFEALRTFVLETLPHTLSPFPETPTELRDFPLWFLSQGAYGMGKALPFCFCKEGFGLFPNTFDVRTFQATQWYLPKEAHKLEDMSGRFL